MTLTYLVHYGEIALKGRNRPDFERQLADNIASQHPGSRVERMRGRMLVGSQRPLDLSRVFGIAWWAPVERVVAEPELVRQAGLRLALERMGAAETFAVRVTRADKRFPLSSQDLERSLGGDIDRASGVTVDLSRPDFTMYVEIAEGVAYLHTERLPGPRGLPAGISGKLVGLYSAGIDSAVASYLMGKRGAEIELVHFHAMASAQRAHEAKAGKLAEQIATFFPRLRVHYVPYHHFQMATAGLDRHQRQELVVFRRYMARLAEQVAEQTGALGLFSGDNLGQVASQTLENLRAVDECLDTSLFRPLVAYDKQEIIDLGKVLGFDAIANQDYKDCCSIIAEHPATRANMDFVRHIEQRIDTERLIGLALEETETLTYDGRRTGTPEALAPLAC
jgi:thiamine biosynthesis protein ThiI